MRLMTVGSLAVALASCTSGPDVRIVAPLDGTTISASVELRCEGHDLAATKSTQILLDGQQYSDLIENTLPSGCDSCSFTISFAGSSIANGMHRIGINFIDDKGPIASDQVTLTFLR